MSENPDTDTLELQSEEKQDSPEKTCNPVLSEEAKLKAKYPNLGQKPGGSDFLMKRLQKGVSGAERYLSIMNKCSSSNVNRTKKYFDSGDYNMAKAKMKSKHVLAAGPDEKLVTGDHIPTPQDLPQRKPNALASKLAG